jgi:lysine-ketoglutarate reductase/saccharopine dehydrogenase-like protein (TIGR00300 family)
MRDLQVGDRVVCGVDGIRIHSAKTRKAQEEFAFMSSGVSSERRVEVAVDEIARDLHALKSRGGKVVVVAGPVVVHTGGGPYLMQLIREGYVQVLLGGNAIAVHDMEQAIFGTSLGVDLARGVGVHEGHKHHLRVINTVRGCGGIAQAVEQGVLTSGIMYECVRHAVPFVLAGSIRDDGPLPETIMDLVQAQQEYSRAIEGAEMIIMLSSMLHSIGTGNMTPAGVKLICVDISPAVVTKLADRGSVESVGIVTDVGLFLNLLVNRLSQLH